MTGKRDSVLDDFREKYPGYLEGRVENVYVEDSGVEDSVSSCNIRQIDVKGSKLKIVLLKTHRDLGIPPVGLAKGYRVSFFATKTIGDARYNGTLVAILNHNTGRRYDAEASLRQEHLSNALKWEDVQEPL